MDLYFAPLACSMASRIALYESELAAGEDVAAAPATRFLQVDTRAKRLVADGSDYFAVNPMGQVPALRLEGGRGLLTENAAILQHLAERFPAAGLAPAFGPGRDRLRQWLSFIGTELHATVFAPLLDRSAPEEAKAYARGKALPRLTRLASHLNGREHLLDEGFSVADAYLATVLNWASAAGIELDRWPILKAWHDRMLTRPSIARALAEERALYAEEQAARRRAAASAGTAAGRGDAVEAGGGLQRLDGPGRAGAGDHPAQDGVEVAVG
jgi:glutathione S-transferase